MLPFTIGKIEALIILSKVSQPEDDRTMVHTRILPQDPGTLSSVVQNKDRKVPEQLPGDPGVGVDE